LTKKILIKLRKICEKKLPTKKIAMAVEFGRSYILEEFLLEPEKRMLSRGGEQVRLANRPFQVLLHLIENRDRLVKRAELLEKFWDGREVYDEALTKCVGAIRKALNEPHENPRFIETRWAEGYRFIGDLDEMSLPSIVEIEKTREIKFILEEHSEPTAAADGQNDLGFGIADLGLQPAAATDLRSAIGNRQSNNQNPKTTKRNIAIVCVVLALFVGALFLLAYQLNRPQPQPLMTNTAPRSIAVLPFKNLTGEAANDYLSDGVTESIINEVSRVESLKVVSRSSVFQFKNKDAPPEEIAGKLNVETILEGGVRRVGDRIRVEARLVSAKDGSILWASDSQEKNISDIFAIQNEIVCGLVAKLQVKSCGEVPSSERYTRNVAAYQAYLKGLAYRNRLELPKAAEFYKEALRLEPDYAPAHEGLAGVYTLMEVNSQVPPQSVAPLAEFHANRALELDENLVGAYLALGTVKTMRNYDLNERIRYYREAIRRNPNYLTARRWLATALLAQGKFEEAETELLRVQESDPLSFGVRLNLAELYLYWRKPDKAIEQAELMLVANPEHAGAHDFLAKAYLQKGLISEAAEEYKKYDPNSPQIVILMATGRVDEARKAAEKFASGETAKNTPYVVGCAFAAVGDKEKALAWLEKAYEVRQADLVSMKIDPALDNLRDDARFQDLLRRVGL
jgi:TolB-like protein/DNA-binding winged helix-turn-helix (wHTH) protein/cytochrome c-type biogenesis protein CcmH/NrfG